MSKAKHPDAPELETRVQTNEVSLEYRSGGLSAIVVEATWKRGKGFEDSTNPYIDEQITVKAKYRLRDGVAELDGYYPQTKHTGQKLWTGVRKAIRVLPYIRDVVNERTSVDVFVPSVEASIEDELRL